MKIEKSEANIYLRLTLIVLDIGLIAYSISSGAGWAYNILLAKAVLGLLAGVTLSAASVKIYRPGIPLGLLKTLDILVWLAYAAAGWWWLFVLTVVADCLMFGLDATEEEYVTYLESEK